MTAHPLACVFLGLIVCQSLAIAQRETQPTARLRGTAPLEMQGDIAAQLVAGVDRFLLNKIAESTRQREAHFDRDTSSASQYTASLEPNRRRLAYRLGVRDERTACDGLEQLQTTNRPALIARGNGYRVLAVRWPVLGEIHGEGLLLEPEDGNPVAQVVAIADADQTPEMIAGLTAGVGAESQFARRLGENGCRVVIPALISREVQVRSPPGGGRQATLSNRELLYRSAFELGRHLIGYELQKVLAAVDWFEQQADGQPGKIGVIGYGEGGLLALYAAALDPRIEAACVSGYFSPREDIWRQPIDRNVFGLLEEFGDAELASMVQPRSLIIDAATAPEVELTGRGGGAPGRLVVPSRKQVEHELDRVKQLVPSRLRSLSVHYADGSDPTEAAFCGREVCQQLFQQLTGPNHELADQLQRRPRIVTPPQDASARQDRLVDQIDRFNQRLLIESPYVRRQFMNIGLTRYDKPDGSNALDTSSPQSYVQSVERFRDFFRHEVVGHFDDPLLDFNARSRQSYDAPAWTGYEVVLDVFPDVIAYGILCVPKNIPPGDRRPVVVCQHGLEGRPQDVVSGDHRAYHDFAAKLAQRGFVTFAPQNLYIGRDNFRTLQRKANPLKKTLFSIIVPQHQQITRWLKSLPMVDPQRIAFYGLSYGGKSAMRIPPLVADYCLSICSADFNDWVWKNASSRTAYSYVYTKEYEIFEFDLGSTFNYAEMAALIAPRPFMVERGHFDGVAPDERVAYEFAKVRHLYAARLGIPDRCRIEWFVGPHTINGQQTFRFLHQHLDWPRP